MSKVCIVDDSRLARTFTAGALRARGIEVGEIEPESVAHVLDELKILKPDLLLVDLLMPTCPGLGLVRAIRKDGELHNLKVVVLSAHRDDSLQPQLEKLAILSFLPKPIDASAVAYVVQELLSPGSSA
jgi:CheY-like chemotaxis protein